MTPYYQDDLVTLWHGDCVEVMRELPDASVDAVVTDPPYELGFMGKGWDASGIAYNPEVWGNALRILKPGGHLLAFGGTRTWHRLAVAIEDAGFEVRDSIAWMYGSGFPKSLDVSKAIDKNNGEAGRVLRFTHWFRTTGLRPGHVNKALQDAKVISANGTIAGHYFAKSVSGQPAIPTPEIWRVIRPLCGDVPAWVDDLVARIAAEREVVGRGTSAIANKDERNRYTVGASKAVEYDITAPATPAAQQWQGWGTALKPAFEPIVVARKPLIGTVAENVLAHGTGALNIDGCRVGTDGGTTKGNPPKGASNGIYGNGINGACDVLSINAGRWPANVILDESQAAELDRQADELPARFFYVPKANSRERPRAGDVAHPTVKPLELMRYLVKLVTPPGGTLLEPFAGSGTTLEACVVEGFQVVGIELTEDYLPLITQRISKPIEQVLL